MKQQVKLPCVTFLAQGSSYLTTEKARLDKILASGSVSASKVEDFAKKSSILGYLTE